MKYSIKICMKLAKVIRFFMARINKYHLFSTVIIFFFAAVVTYTNLGTEKEFIGDDAGVAFHFPTTQLNLVSNMWDSYTFPGRSNVAASIGLIHINFINILNKIGFTPIVVDRIYYFLFFFLSGLGLYFLSFNICRKLFNASENALWIVSITGAVFYMLNNFTMILLSFPPTGYIYSYMLLPWIFLLYLSDFHIDNNLFKRLVFAIIFLLILSGNPSNTISIVVLLLIYEIFFRENGKIIRNWKNFIVTLVMILLLSSYILLPTLGNSGNPYGQVLGNDVSIAYNSSDTSIKNLLRLMGHPAQSTFVFFQFLLSNKAFFANFLILTLALVFLLKRKIGKLEIFLFLTFLIFLFLAKAEHIPFSSINKGIYLKVPLFEMYRASYFKFVYFCVFSLSILLAISLLFINERISKLRLPLFVKILIGVFPLLVVIYSATPFFSGKVARDIHKTIIPTEYRMINTYFSSLRTDFSILSLPQLPSGLTLDWGNGNYYGSGANPDPYLLGRPVWSNGWFLSGNPTSNQFSFYKNMLGRTNIKYILLHKDIPENYYFKVGIKGSPKGQTNYNQLNDQISTDPDFKLVLDNKYFKIFEVSQEKYTPHFSIPENSIVSDKNVKNLLKIGSGENWPINSAMFFQDQNTGKEKMLDILPSISNADNKPSLEFKKINSTKYRIIVHGASKQFPLIFNESFQNGWDLYLTGAKPTATGVDFKSQLIDQTNLNYKILEGNGGDQASKDGLKDFINRGLVSNLGTGSQKVPDYSEEYDISFVSKNFQGVIQNDNLKNGTIFETWFKTPVADNASHLKVNGYANSWVVDPQNICFQDSKCIKNADGTYDLEFVIEFWPQRLFYLGIALSVLTLIFCLGYIILHRKRNYSSRI